MNMSTFVAAAAHDMKNSVSVIAAYLEDALHELAKMEADPPSAATLSTCQALYETQRVNGNLVQLMAIYKLEEGMYPFEPAHIHLEDFAEELLGRVRPLARLKALDLQCEMQAGVPDWIFDHDLIGSVLIQALFGAVRYAKRTVRLSLEVVEGRLELEVADDGEGFPEFMLAQGFPSRQGIDVHTGSTGLGLFFARLAAGLHRRGEVTGSTRLCNGGELGGGCFTLVLP